MAVDSADEFYSIMGVLTREMLEFGLMDTNNLIKVSLQHDPGAHPTSHTMRTGSFLGGKAAGVWH